NDRKSTEAEKLLRDVLRRAPSYGPALHSLGSLLLDRGSPDTALEFLDRAVKSNPLNAETWYSLGSAYLKLGKMTEALDAARRAALLKEDVAQYQKLLRDIQERPRK